MRLSDAELGNYVRNMLALPGDQRNEYRQQVNRLLEKLEALRTEDGSNQIKKFRRAGSLEKGTSNRPRAGRSVDADVGVYFAVDDPSAFDISELQRRIKRILLAAYPQKSEGDFDDARSRTFGVVFKGTGLEVDLVPIVSLDECANYGIQYSRAGDPIRTSVKVHVDHYRSHAARDIFLAPTLRLAKRWRNWQELDGIQSFYVELMLSYLVDVKGPATGLEESIRRLFLFIIRDLRHGIAFDGAEPTGFPDAVVIVDPANRENNVAAQIQAVERDALIAASRRSYETITWAQSLPGKGETIAAWKELFGNSFSID